MQPLVRAVLAALAYFASARLGYALAIPNGLVTLWPPSGVILGLLLLSERRQWPALVIGAFAGSLASDLLSGFSPSFAVAAAGANASETLLAAAVVTWRLGPNVRLANLRSVVAFVGGAAIISNAGTAILGALATNYFQSESVPRAWTTWWLGDGLGMLTVTPVVLGWTSGSRRVRAMKPAVALEAGVLIVLLVMTAVVTLGSGFGWSRAVGPYAAFPLLFWAALRFGPFGGATATLILAAVGTWNAALGVGPFVTAGGSGLEIALRLYIYLALASLSSLIPAAMAGERRAVERQLSTSESHYRTLFDGSPQPAWVYDLETLRFLSVNQAAVAEYGYSAEEFRSLTIRDIRPPEDVAAFLESVNRLHDGSQVMGSIWRHRRKDGSVMAMEIHSRPLDFAGRRARLVLANNVSQRLEADERLTQSEERFRQIAEHIQEAFYVVDITNGSTLYISPTWATIWGRPLEQGYDRSIWFTSIHPDDQPAMQASQEAVMRGETSVVTFRVIRPDGAIRWVLGRSFPVRDDTGRVYRLVGLSSDVTEVRQVQEHFVQAQKMEAVGRLAAGVAHDFNNLLTVILSWSDFLLEKPGRDAEDLEMLQQIRDSGARAASLTRQLLAFSRKQVIAPRVLDLNAVVQDASKLVRRLVGEDVEFRLVLAPNLGPLLADEGQIQQVIMNLVVNARDAMPNGGLLTVETASVDHPDAPGLEDEGSSAESARGFTMLAVTDTGTGMSAETKAHLFEAFFTTKGVGKGTGLGLATVQGIVEQSGGFIRVESEPGSGAAFRLYWPVLGQSGVITEADSGPQGVPRGTETILVVEDDAEIRGLSRRILAAQGYTVLVAEAGGQALATAAIHEGRIDLLMTDVIMPGMTGRELADQLRIARRDVRVLYVSGYTDDRIDDHGVLAPGVQFLQKPFTPSTLVRKVREVLAAPPPRAS
jgi:two-component system cell cycle sensor histidine kinase/response regulator CckA